MMLFAVLLVKSLGLWMVCRGGLIKWADLTGVKHVHDTLEKYAKQFKPAGLEGFFQPCQYLADAARQGTLLGKGVASSKL